MQNFNTTCVDPSWQPMFDQALDAVDPAYLDRLRQRQGWLPGHQRIFSAFSVPRNKIHTILFGESPYPRTDSANGYAFWDARVHELWSQYGLSRAVNRATSLRNFIKMLLLAEGLLLADDVTQPAITQIDKTPLVQTIDDLFLNMLDKGFLLLNASLVLNQKVAVDAKCWQPFIVQLLDALATSNPDVTLVLFGKIAEKINANPIAHQFEQLVAEHPYNISFIQNPTVLDFFKPLHLLRAQPHVR